MFASLYFWILPLCDNRFVELALLCRNKKMRAMTRDEICGDDVGVFEGHLLCEPHRPAAILHDYRWFHA